jgi:SAM-dependent methyltransferase
MAVAPGYTALICPACKENQLWLAEEGLECRRCGHVVPCEAGVNALNPAVGEVPPLPGAPDAVAKAFFPTEAARASHFRDLDIILGQVLGRKSLGDVLELGASGGAWTCGLSQDPRVRRLYATETSPSALSHLAEITGGEALILESGTESLGIEMATLDLVVGRGALAREADPAPLLSSIKRWLKPGGAAVFLEPCLQGKIWTAFVMDLIRRFEANGAPGGEAEESGGFLGRKSSRAKGLSQLATMRLEGAARQVIRGAKGEGTGDDRVFDMAGLTNLGYELGFSECYPIDQPQEDVTPLRRLRNTLDGLLGPEKGVLERYTPIFEALEETFNALPETAPVAPNIYFVFRA